MNPKVALSAGLAVGLVALGGCDPRALDDLADEAWVDSSGKPDGLDSKDYGVAVAFGGSGGVGLRVLAATQTPAGFARLNFDTGGSLATTAALVAEASGEPINQLDERPAAAGDPSNFGGDQGSIALGATDGESAYALMIDMESETPRLGRVDMRLPSTTGPIGLAFGAMEDGAPGSGPGADLVAATASGISILPSYQTQGAIFTCAFPEASPITALHVADIVASGEPAIVVATQDGNLNAHAAAGVVASNGVSCGDLGPAAIVIPHPGDTAVRAMASGDFDGDGSIDLAIGMPAADQVVLLLALGSTQIMLEAPADAAEFGAILAAGDFDDDGKDDLAVGDPDATSDGVGGAGAVYLYASGEPGLAATLHDASPEGDQHFGQAITGAAFDDATDVLVVGAKDEIFTYFRNPLGGVDVRR